jgi:hypothetical protein
MNNKFCCKHYLLLTAYFIHLRKFHHSVWNINIKSKSNAFLVLINQDTTKYMQEGLCSPDLSSTQRSVHSFMWEHPPIP